MTNVNRVDLHGGLCSKQLVHATIALEKAFYFRNTKTNLVCYFRICAQKLVIGLNKSLLSNGRSLNLKESLSRNGGANESSISGPILKKQKLSISSRWVQNRIYKIATVGSSTFREAAI